MSAEPRAQHGGQETDANKPDRASFFRDEDPVVSDFNSFFEKLSTIDDLSLGSGEVSAATAQPPGKGMESAAARRAARATALHSARATRKTRPATPAPAATTTPKMQVLNSTTAFPEPDDAAHAGQGPAVHREPGVEIDDGRLTAKDLARFLKLVLIGLVLFAMGLGAGWAALSLPERYERLLLDKTGAGQPPAESAQKTGNQDETPGGDPVKWFKKPGRGVAVKSTTDAAAPTGNGQSALGPATAEAPAAASSAGINASAAPSISGTAISGTATEGEAIPVSARSRQARPDPIRLPVISSGDFAPAAVEQDSGPARVVSGKRFSLQVGACGSASCVKGYQALLADKVKTASIQIIRQDGVNGTIHRIRIGPFTREEAEAMRKKLIAADAQFDGAYLIANP